VAWLDCVAGSSFTETGTAPRPGIDAPPIDAVTPAELATWIAAHAVTVIDFAPSAQHVKGHVPGAHWALRSQLKQALAALPKPPQRIVATCGNSRLARFAAADLQALTDAPVAVLEGGNTAWAAQHRPLETGELRLLSPRIDRYHRPYEGTDAPHAAMQAYLDWEFGLVEQLARDATHGFRVLAAG
jgi:rhodanese-related sulfurtransferase